MAVLNRLDAETTSNVLAHWIEEQVGHPVEIHDLEIPSSAGISMTTMLFTASWRDGEELRTHELVARVEPNVPGLFEKSSLATEFRLLDTLHRNTDIPVAPVRWLETDPTLLGSPFMVMDRVHGKVPGDDPPFVVEGWVADLAPADRRRLFENAIEVLARLHALDVDALELGYLDRPERGRRGIDQQVGILERYYRWASEGTPSPTIEAALEWADRNRPGDDRIVLSWGDSRLGNIIYSADLTVAAILDWEIASLASPQLDMGWFVLFVRYYSEGIGVPLLEGLPTRDEVISRYEELAGHALPDIDYYERLALIRLSIIMMRIGKLMIEGGALPADNPMPISNPASQLLARLLELPPPIGDSTNFVGNR
ncbi:MAG TPA: phosphotransferase family protein [Acidimicrobiales bacterium]